MKKTLILTLICLFVGVLSAFSFESEQSQRSEQSQNGLEMRSSEAEILKFDPHQINVDKIKRQSGRFLVEQDELTIRFSDNSFKGIIMEETKGPKQGQKIRMGLAIDSEDAEEYIDGDTYFHSTEDVTVGLQSIEGGARQIIIIKSNNAPTTYPIELDLPAGSTLEMLKVEGSQKEEHGIVILDNDGQFISFIAPPWAFDADGLEVPTHFELDGTNIIQVIDFSNANLPVVADPNMCSRYYTANSVWISRSGQISLSLQPTACGRAFTGSLVRKYHWEEVRRKFNSSNNWYNTWGLQKQLYCHMDLALFKSRWNLEPHRPNVSYLAHLRALCNP